MINYDLFSTHRYIHNILPMTYISHVSIHLRLSYENIRVIYTSIKLYKTNISFLMLPRIRRIKIITFNDLSNFLVTSSLGKFKCDTVSSLYTNTIRIL